MTKISPGTIVIGVFAVLFGLIGAYAVRQHLNQKPEEVVQPSPPSPLPVPVASINLEPGRPLTLGDIAILRVPPDQLEAHGAVGAYMRDSRQLLGRILREPLKKGAVFYPEMLYPEGMGPSIAERLKPGYRAVTIPIENNDAVAGMVTPGSVVDVFFRTTPGEKIPETTVTLLEGVEVLALEKVSTPGVQLVSKDARPAPITVTLAVTPNQANALRVVDGRGEMSLAMRNPGDRVASTGVRAQTLEGLLGLRRPKTHQTDIYRGTSRNTVTFVESAPKSYVVEEFPVRAEIQEPTSLTDPAPQAEPGPQGETLDDAAQRDRASGGAEARVVAPASQRYVVSASATPRMRRGLSGLPLLSEEEAAAIASGAR